jgi:hypothetical protein
MLDAFPNKNDLKEVDATLPLLSNFALEYAIKRTGTEWNTLPPGGLE